MLCVDLESASIVVTGGGEEDDGGSTLAAESSVVRDKDKYLVSKSELLTHSLETIWLLRASELEERRARCLFSKGREKRS